MPYGDDKSRLDKILRVLIYGPDKTKKTWWACRAAEAGFNVILIDGDKGSRIVDQLPLAAQKRILVVNLGINEQAGTFARFMAMLLKPNNTFIWDEQACKEVFSTRDPEHSYIRFNANLLGQNDVLVPDNWTALADSTLLEYAMEKKIDLFDAKKEEWDGYGYQGRFLSYALIRLKALECHSIVPAHSYVYEKWDRRDKKNPILVSQTTMPISSSGPHGHVVGSKFENVFYFERAGKESVYINTSGDKDRYGGSRLAAPEKIKWEDLPPSVLFNKLGAKATGEPCRGAVWYAPGEEVPGLVLAGQGGTSLPRGPAVIGAGGGSLRDRLALATKGG